MGLLRSLCKILCCFPIHCMIVLKRYLPVIENITHVVRSYKIVQPVETIFHCPYHSIVFIVVCKPPAGAKESPSSNPLNVVSSFFGQFSFR